MEEHDRVSRTRNACVQNRIIGFNTSEVWRINSLVGIRKGLGVVASEATFGPRKRVNLQNPELLNRSLMTHHVFAVPKVYSSTSPK